MHVLGAPTLVQNPHEIQNLDLLIGRWFPPIQVPHLWMQLTTDLIALEYLLLKKIIHV